jgi:vancomycin resistance protein YoaR
LKEASAARVFHFMENTNGSPGNTGRTRSQALLFMAKTWVHRARRAIFQPRAVRLTKSPPPTAAPLAAESCTPLRASSHLAELRLQEGKVRNLAVAARFLDGLRIPADEVFSFWRHVPRPTRRAGFTEGRELREGCIIPSTGGGLCQLSNALYAVALDAGCEIVERHAHSRIIPGSAAEAGRDATVFWNYVDLRFRPRHDLWLEVVLSGGDLVVRLRGKSGFASAVPALATAPLAMLAARSCENCGEETCFRHREFHASSSARRAG